jgi:calmodulin
MIDKDGRIAIKDLGQVVGSLGQKPTGTNLQNAIKGLNLSGKTINFQEFLAVIFNLSPDTLNEDQVGSAFWSLGMDKKGSFDAKELKRVMSEIGRRSL